MTPRACMFLLLCFVFGFALPGFSQIPDEFVNLKVLPREIQKAELVKIMKSYTAALGVRCTFCHVGKEGAPLSTYDFPSDQLEHKKTARIMMKMTQDINAKYLAELGKPAEKLVPVKCATCHHGQKEPLLLEDVLLKELAEGGAPAAIRKYQELRKEYFGSYAFDFSEDPLNRLARRLYEEKKVGDGIEMLNLNEKYYPKSPNVQFQLAELHLASGSKDLALAHYRKCLELEPDNDYVKKKIAELSKPPGEP